MPDISMCQNDTCDKKLECYRYMAIPNQWQSYMLFKNICFKENNYQYSYEIDKTKPLRKIELPKEESRGE